MMVRVSRLFLTLSMLGSVALGCAGRLASDQDVVSLNDGVTFEDGTLRDIRGIDPGGTADLKYDGTGPNDNTTDYTGPVANAIAAIQQSDASVQCPPDGTTTTPAFVNGLTGLALDVVVLSPRYVVSSDKTTGEVTKYGYFVADVGLTQSESWRGIAAVVPTSVTSDEWHVGDALSLVGDHVEYYCFSQVAVTSAVMKGTAPNPAPVDVDPADLGSQDRARAEAYEGVLVRIRNVTVTTTPALGTDGKDHGSFQATGGVIVANDFRVPYMSTASDSRTVGDTFTEIVGIMKFSYDQYILVPRSGDDMILEGTQPGDQGPDASQDIPAGQDVVSEAVSPTGTTVEAIQSASQSTGCSASSIQNIQTGLDFADLVVVSPKFVASKTKLDGYYVSDVNHATAGDFTGVEMTIDVAKATNFQPGDVLQITGDWLEFYCMTEIKATDAVKSGTAAIPAPKVVAPAALKAAASSEPLEGVLIELDNVVVTKAISLGSDSADHGAFEVADGVVIGNDFGLNYMSTATDQRKLGDSFTKIVGVVSYSFGKYTVFPRTNADLVLGSVVLPDTTEPTPDVVEPSPEVVDPGTDVVVSGYSIVDLQGGTDSDSCTTGVVNGTPKYGITMTTSSAVVTSPKYSATAAFDGYYIADANGATTDAGMILLVAKTLATAFVPGDRLAITGDYKEYFCMSEIVVASTATAPATVGTVSKTGTTTVPAATVLAASVLQNGGGAGAEPYEGQIVTIQGVAVTSITSPDTFGWFQVGTGIEVVSDFFYPVNTAPYTPILNDSFTSITGALKFHHGKYRIAPRTAADFVKAP
jgi:hypothetical protein